jgi:uncharacterized coiled-coil protein SlyX
MELEGRVDNLEGRVGKLENKADTLDTTVTALRLDLTEIRAVMPSVATKTDISECSERLSSKIDSALNSQLNNALNAVPWKHSVAALGTMIALVGFVLGFLSWALQLFKH